MSDLRKTISKRLAEARAKAGMTQQQLADAIGASHRSVICHYEKGTCLPELPKLIEIAKVFNVSLDYLVDL
jgi:DNA-binding XRE family transcriptional regulator